MRLGTPSRPIWTVLSRRDLMDKVIRLRVSARKQMKRNRATHCPGHCTSASVTAAGDCADYLLFIRFLHVAQQAFVKADSFLRAAGLICGRLPAFFVAGFRVAAGFDPRFRSAHRAFIAADIRRRAAALIMSLRGPFVSPLCGGRPRRRIGPETSPSRAEIAWFNRERSDFS